MVSAFGYYASAKGMVLVPNLSGLTRPNAITAIQNAGLTPVAGSVINTGNISLDDIIASQTPSSGTLVDYETNVQYDYYDYVSTPPFFPPFFPSFTPPFFPFFPSFPVTPSVTVSAIVNSGTSVTVNWSFTNFTQGSYQLTRTGTGQYPIVNGSDTTLTDLTVACNSTYTWSFVFYSGPNGTGSQLTGSVTATTSACPATFTINSTSSSVTSITYSWGNAPAGTASYRVYYTDQDTPSVPVTITSTSHTFNDLSPNTAYVVYVEARNSSNVTLATAFASVSTQPVSSPFFPPSFPFFPPSFPFFPPSFPSFPDFPPNFPPEFGVTTYYGCCGDATSVSGQYASLSAATSAMESFCATETMTALVSGPSTSPSECLCGGVSEPYPGQCFCSGGVWIC